MATWLHQVSAEMRDIRNGSPRQFAMEKSIEESGRLDHSNFLLAVRISNAVEIFICCSQDGRSNVRMAFL